jgi:hypothetical protein
LTPQQEQCECGEYDQADPDHDDPGDSGRRTSDERERNRGQQHHGEQETAAEHGPPSSPLVLAPELLHTLFEYPAHFLEKRFGEFPIVLRAQFASSG